LLEITARAVDVSPNLSSLTLPNAQQEIDPAISSFDSRLGSGTGSRIYDTVDE
jgi:hypothetical protein